MSKETAPERTLTSSGPIAILSQAAHLDWDWLNWFPTNTDNQNPTDQDNRPYFQGSTQPADTIFLQAENLLTSFPDYYYSICEIGFLQAFAEHQPDAFASMKATGRLVIVGGGITSPDNLIPAGECILRNYLLGTQWLAKSGIEWSGQVWMPDDFGHDSQLPVLLEAMGVMGVGFARIPGACNQQNVAGNAARKLLDDGGVAFFWRAADQSEVFAHWLEAHYNQGDDIDSSGNDYTSPQGVATCVRGPSVSTPNEHINNYLSTNRPSTPVPIIYVHVSDDFKQPIGGATPPEKPDPSTTLMAYANAWNTEPEPGPNQDVHVTVGTFDGYVRAVMAYAKDHPSVLKTRAFHANLAESIRSFESTPYWMGFYASRPALKFLHYAATRALVGAEIFGLLALLPSRPGSGTSQDPAIFEGWNALAPSTHHDYVTGTSASYVYDEVLNGVEGEQLALSRKALSLGQAARSAARERIASKIDVTQPSAVVFNQLGIARRGIVYVDSDGPLPACFESEGTLHQRAADGGLLLYYGAPALGYELHALSESPVLGPLDQSTDADGNVTLSNEFLSATISRTTGALIAVVDLEGSGANILQGEGNVLAPYTDDGDAYRFGYEKAYDFTPISVTSSAQSLSVVEEGPIRVRATAQVQVTEANNAGFQESYEVSYSLVAGEPFLRVAVTGKAPANTAILVKFPLQSTDGPAVISRMQHGTPYHWDYKTTEKYPSITSHQTHRDAHAAAVFDSTFQATHDFVVPCSTDGRPWR